MHAHCRERVWSSQNGVRDEREGLWRDLLKINQKWNIKAFSRTHAFRRGPSRKASFSPFEAADGLSSSFSLLARGIEALKIGCEEGWTISKVMMLIEIGWLLYNIVYPQRSRNWRVIASCLSPRLISLVRPISIEMAELRLRLGCAAN